MLGQAILIFLLIAIILVILLKLDVTIDDKKLPTNAKKTFIITLNLTILITIFIELANAFALYVLLFDYSYLDTATSIWKGSILYLIGVVAVVIALCQVFHIKFEFYIFGRKIF